MSSITMTHVILMIALAVAAVLVIWWGTVLRRRRRAAQTQVIENFEKAEEHGATSEPVASLPGEETAIVSADIPETAADETAVADDLTRIKGLGPRVAALLAARGITRMAQLAALDPAPAAALDAELGSFRGRMARDRWVEQAKLLNAGDRAGYEAAFGKLDG